MAERYSTEQVQQILVSAMGQSEQEGFSRSQLEEMAADLGISLDTLKQAEDSLQKIPAAVQTTANQSPKQQFHQRLRTYIIVNIFLIALNFTLSGAITWAIYPLLGWGLGLLLSKDASSCAKTKYSS
ncbi:MAG: 2TM domain-containing protein [Cyanobacteria bacterium P01_H01_bin.21]